MKFFNQLILTAVYLLYTTVVVAQATTIQQEYNEHIEQAERYRSLSLFVESSQELNRAIAIAKEHDMEREFFNASISRAELYRITEDYEAGIQLLHELEQSDRYPDLHVRKLSRLAALTMEAKGIKDKERVLSVLSMLEEALIMAEANRLSMQEAILKNELGYVKRSYGNKEEAILLLRESAATYQALDEEAHLTRPLINLVNVYQDVNDYRRADSVAAIVFQLLNGKERYSDERDLYDALAYRAYVNGDSLEHYQWMVKSLSSTQKHLEVLHSQQMALFRVWQETERIRADAEASEQLALQTAEELEVQTARSNELLFYAVVLGVLVLGVVALLFRERKLKKKLAFANERYQMLMVESNHRIKNNLQMIISMLQYASHGLNEENSRAFHQMSSKIHTVSALHQHLYADVHNERVELGSYFNDIISMYQDMSKVPLHIEKHIDEVRIQSERIVYFGLILNELLANTVEHRPTTEVPIKISITKQDNNFLFTYCDGANIPIDRKKGTGSTLIQQLIHRVGGNGFVFNPRIGNYQFQFDA